jgi:Fis family transcriptional regulator
LYYLGTALPLTLSFILGETKMEVVITQRNQAVEENLVAKKENNDDDGASTLREHVLNAVEYYFQRIRSSQGAGMHTPVIEEVEAAMYEATMRFTKGNQVQAAKVLGVARGTLRTKLKQYFGTTQVGGLYHKYSLKPFKQIDKIIY